MGRRLLLPTKQPPVQAEPGYIIMIQSTEAFGRISSPGFARAARTWIFGALFLYVSGGIFLGVWVLHVEYGTLDSSGDDFVCGVQCLVRGWLHVLHQCLAFDELHIFSTLPWTRILKCLVFILTRNGEECSVDASGSVLDALLAPGNLDIFDESTWLAVVMMFG